jgi:hypothetical protein
MFGDLLPVATPPRYVVELVAIVLVLFVLPYVAMTVIRWIITGRWRFVLAGEVRPLR